MRRGSAPASRAPIEAAIQAALDAESVLNNVYVRLERDRDGHVFTATKGVPNNRYISASTVKPITCAAILQAVADGDLALTTQAIDLVPEFDALAVDEQRNIELQHLLSFTSGLFTNQTPTPCANSASTWAEFVTCVSGLATINADRSDFVPGTLHTYATDQHALASIMAVNATGADDWGDYLTAWIARTGLFSGLTWTDVPGSIFGGNISVMYTSEEYLAFWKAIADETILTPALCRDMYADAIPDNPERTTTYAWGIGEDWHFGRGMWIEERREDFVGKPLERRFSTIGVSGQYSYFDKRTRVRCAVSATFTPDFLEGFNFARAIDPLVERWALAI